MHWSFCTDEVAPGEHHHLKMINQTAHTASEKIYVSLIWPTLQPRGEKKELCKKKHSGNYILKPIAKFWKENKNITKDVYTNRHIFLFTQFVLPCGVSVNAGEMPGEWQKSKHQISLSVYTTNAKSSTNQAKEDNAPA